MRQDKLSRLIYLETDGPIFPQCLNCNETVVHGLSHFS